MEGPYRYTKTTAPTKHYGVSKQGKTPNVSESEKLTMRMIIVIKKNQLYNFLQYWNNCASAPEFYWNYHKNSILNIILFLKIIYIWVKSISCLL